MKTIKQWIETLPEPYRNLALNNTSQEILNDKDYCASLRDALLNAFSWEETDKGANFWSTVSRSVFTEMETKEDVKFNPIMSNREFIENFSGRAKRNATEEAIKGRGKDLYNLMPMDLLSKAIDRHLYYANGHETVIDSPMQKVLKFLLGGEEELLVDALAITSILWSKERGETAKVFSSTLIMEMTKGLMVGQKKYGKNHFSNEGVVMPVSSCFNSYMGHWNKFMAKDIHNIDPDDLINHGAKSANNICIMWHNRVHGDDRK